MYTGYFDGATNPNPGEMGLGACLISDIENTEVDAAIHYKRHGTNNEAEYYSLILLLKRAITLNIKSIRCFGDSKLIVNHYNRVFNVSEKFVPYLLKVDELAKKFDFISIEWVRRNKNTRADELSKIALKLKKSAVLDVNNNEIAGTSPIETKEKKNKTNKVKVQPARVKPIQQRLPKVKVSVINNEVLMIVEGGSTVSFVDVKRGRCTCDRFISTATCDHSETVNKLKKSTRKGVVL